MNKRGVALCLVLGVLLVVVVLTDVVLHLITSQTRISNHQVRRIQANYAAQAAINYAFERLRQNDTDWVPTASAKTAHMCRSSGDALYSGASPDWIETDLPFPVENVTVTVSPLNADGVYPITARANYTYN